MLVSTSRPSGTKACWGADDQDIANRLRNESRSLLTLDLDFANIQMYPPEQYCGIIVLRLKPQGKATVLEYVRHIAVLLTKRRLKANCGSSNVTASASGGAIDGRSHAALA